MDVDLPGANKEKSMSSNHSEIDREGEALHSICFLACPRFMSAHTEYMYVSQDSV